MDRWVVYAFLSMLFAGVTAVVAKQGLVGISGELGLAVRTLFVAGLVFVFAAVAIPWSDWGKLTTTNFAWLGLSAVATTASWIFYYKAIEDGEVSTVALIDKGSFLIAVVLAALFLGEKITTRTALGAVLILAGLVVTVTGRPR